MHQVLFVAYWYFSVIKCNPFIVAKGPVLLQGETENAAICSSQAANISDTVTSAM